MKMTKPFTQLVLSLCCAAATGSALADEYIDYPTNPVLRPITLPDTMVSLTAAAGYAEELDGSEEVFIVPGVQYGVTDNFTIGLDGLTYRFYHDDGLQMGVNFGVRDAHHSDRFGDSIATGISVFGKKIMSNHFAVTFGIDFINWDEEIVSDRSEVKYDIGLIYNIAPDWTVFASYHYRDLEDFAQDSANRYQVGLNYVYSQNIDVGLFAFQSDYDEKLNGYYLHNEVEQGAGIFVNWRF